MFLESAKISKLLNSNPNAKTKQINYQVKKNTYTYPCTNQTNINYHTSNHKLTPT